jgi:hypothetical protein
MDVIDNTKSRSRHLCHLHILIFTPNLIPIVIFLPDSIVHTNRPRVWSLYFSTRALLSSLQFVLRIFTSSHSSERLIFSFNFFWMKLTPCWKVLCTHKLQSSLIIRKKKEKKQQHEIYECNTTFIACWWRKYENLFTQDYHIPWGGNMILLGEYIFLFHEPHAINVLLYRMKPRKHIHVRYCWQTYFKSIGTLSQTFKNHGISQTIL